MEQRRPRTDGERLAVIEECVMRMDKYLFGVDGTMGQLDKMDARLTKLEGYRLIILGVLTGATIGSGVALVKIVETIAK